jgi:pimeloyl-ACP methyl ester carboxylesterase
MIADTFEMIADELAASYRLVTYRRRGFHGTPAHQDCTISKGAAHMLQMDEPDGMAAGLFAFFARHPMG